MFTRQGTTGTILIGQIGRSAALTVMEYKFDIGFVPILLPKAWRVALVTQLKHGLVVTHVQVIIVHLKLSIPIHSNTIFIARQINGKKTKQNTHKKE